jgi:hypothetical protein
VSVFNTFNFDSLFDPLSVILAVSLKVLNCARDHSISMKIMRK